jgi:hypothetical protein
MAVGQVYGPLMITSTARQVRQTYTMVIYGEDVDPSMVETFVLLVEPGWTDGTIQAKILDLVEVRAAEIPVTLDSVIVPAVYFAK